MLMSDTNISTLTLRDGLQKSRLPMGQLPSRSVRCCLNLPNTTVLTRLKSLDLPTACQMIVSKELKIVHSNEKKECIIKDQMAFALEW